MSTYFFENLLDSSFTCKVLYAIIPNWQFFWMPDAISNNKSIPLNYMFWALSYTVLYVFVCTIIATVCFKNKEAGDNKI